MVHLRDMRLWLMCLITVVGTAAFGINMHGALRAPESAGDPTPLPAVVRVVQTPSGVSMGLGA
jgi:hypothetical protein